MSLLFQMAKHTFQQLQNIYVDGVVIQREGDSLPSNEMPVNVTIACGLPKGDKLDLIVQKGTELGMAGIIPFRSGTIDCEMG